jgi:hypothetical protein
LRSVSLAVQLPAVLSGLQLVLFSKEEEAIQHAVRSLLLLTAGGADSNKRCAAIVSSNTCRRLVELTM